MNIQHVESLNDVVAQITRVRVRETVPDSILDQADDIEIIDIAPDDLLQRLREGKIYLPHQAERALEHFFSPGNLTALRELALRRTAQRVDDQLLTHMQAHAIAGPWAAGERVIVCISEDPRCAGLVRYAKRLADRLRAPWIALSVEGRRSLQLSHVERDRIADTLRLADRLGGEAVTVPGAGRRVADDVIAYARDNNVTHIVIGKSERSQLFELLHGSIVHDLVRRSGNISVHVIAGDAVEGAELVPRKSVRAAPDGPSFDAKPYLAAALAVAVALGISLVVQRFFAVQSVEVVFLTAVVVVAVRFGLYPSLGAVVGGSLCYNFFFLPPLYTFTIADPSNIAALFFFTVVAVLVSNLAARTRSEAVIAQGRARATEALYGFSRKLASCGNLDDVLWATVFQIASMLKVRVVVLLPEAGRIAVAAGYPPEDQLDEADIGAAKWCFDNNRAAGRSADTLPGAKRLFLPMHTGRGAIGVVGIDSDVPGPILTPERRRLLDALTDQGGLAIERVRLVEDLDRAKLLTETDRLRQALLTSISHDLRTPLASVLGAATHAAGPRRRARRRQQGRTPGHGHRRGGAPQPLHRQPARHDPARSGRRHAEPRRTRCRRDRRQRSAAGRQDPRRPPRRGRDRPRPAGPGPRRGAVRTGPVQPARQCRQIRAGGTTIRVQTWQDRRQIHLQVLDEGDGLPPRRRRADLRQVLPRPERRPGAGRHGPRPCHRARLRRSHARHDHGHQPDGPHGRRLHADVRGARRPATRSTGR